MASSGSSEADSGVKDVGGDEHDVEGVGGYNGDSEAGPDVAGEEEFRSASDVFRDSNAFDFLSQHGTGSAASHLARESLYVRFDPLIGGRPSMMPASSREANPASNAAVPDLNEDEERPVHERDLMTMQSPSPKKDSSSKKSLATLSAEAGLLNSDLKQHEWQEQVARKDSQINELDRLIEDNLVTIESLRAEVKMRKESEEQMKQVLKEYEKTISELIAEKEKEKSCFELDRQNLVAEREQAAEDLRNVETAFADVHRKYERTKQVVESFKQNEETLKRCVDEYVVRLKKQDHKYELLKAHAEETLEKANREIEAVARAQDAELAKLTAMLKKTESKATSLERTVEQKSKENMELSEIVDDLISRVGVAAE